MSRRLQKLRDKWNDARLQGLKGIPNDIAPDTVFDAVVSADPTPNHKYVDWCLNAWSRGTFQWEDIRAGSSSIVGAQILRFDANKHRIDDPAMRSLMKYRGPGELDEAMDKAGVSLTPDFFDLSSNQQKKMMMGRALLESISTQISGSLSAHVPLTQFASNILGRQTRWCTAAENDNQFHHYRRNGFLTIFMKGNRKFQGYTSGNNIEDFIILNERDTYLTPDDISFLGEDLESIRYYLLEQETLFNRHYSHSDILERLDTITAPHDYDYHIPHVRRIVLDEFPLSRSVTSSRIMEFPIKCHDAQKFKAEVMGLISHEKEKSQTRLLFEDTDTFKAATEVLKLDDVVMQFCNNPLDYCISMSLRHNPVVAFNAFMRAKETDNMQLGGFCLFAFANPLNDFSRLAEYTLERNNEAFAELFKFALEVNKKKSVFVFDKALDTFIEEYVSFTAIADLHLRDDDVTPGRHFYERLSEVSKLIHGDDVDLTRFKIPPSYYHISHPEIVKRYSIVLSDKVSDEIRKHGTENRRGHTSSETLRKTISELKEIAHEDMRYCRHGNKINTIMALTRQGIDPKRLLKNLDYNDILHSEHGLPLVTILTHKGFMDKQDIYSQRDITLCEYGLGLKTLFATKSHLFNASIVDEDYRRTIPIEQAIIAEVSAHLIIMEAETYEILDRLKKTPVSEWTPHDFNNVSEIIGEGKSQRLLISHISSTYHDDMVSVETEVSKELSGALKSRCIPISNVPMP